MTRAASLTAVDSSVLVAAVLPWHEQHDAAQQAIRRARKRGRLLLASRTLVETYSVLTRLPAPHRLAPADAASLLELNFRKDGIDQLEGSECWEFVAGLPDRRIAGGGTYDAEIVAVADKAGADTLLTLDRRGFGRSAPAGVEIVVPE